MRRLLLLLLAWLFLGGCAPPAGPPPGLRIPAGASARDGHSQLRLQDPPDAGSPSIRTEHIFYGGINGHGEATGFHYRATGEGSGRARLVPGTQTPADVHGVYQAHVEIKDAQGQWVAKNAPSTFYPDAWSQEQVLAEIRSAFARRRLGRGNAWEGVADSGVRISGFTDKQGNIITAYPLQGRQ